MSTVDRSADRAQPTQVMAMSEHRSGVETHSVASGWQGVVHHGDGTATKVWAPTPAKARQKAREVADE